MTQSPHSVYLDYQATTPLDPEVAKSMAKIQESFFGNPASGSHSFGWEAEGVLRAARETICRCLNIKQAIDLSFTSCATESNNWVIQKTRLPNQERWHLISQVTEHKSVLEPLHYMQSLGHEVTLLPVDNDGKIREKDLKKALKPETALVSLMMVNNEIGTIYDIKSLCQMVHEQSSALFHTDATQAVGKIKVDVLDLGVDFLSCSAHKFYGPKGIGVLYHNTHTTQDRFGPLLMGGGQEFGWRSGTVNVPGIHGMALALDRCCQMLENEYQRITELASHFLTLIDPLFQSGVTLNGSKTERIPHNINLTLPHVPANVILTQLSGFALSAGSACATGSGAGSYVIEALRGNSQEALSTLRISLGRDTTTEIMNTLAKALISAVDQFAKLGFA